MSPLGSCFFLALTWSSAWKKSVSLASVCVVSESSQLMLKVITIKQSFSRLTEKMFPWLTSSMAWLLLLPASFGSLAYLLLQQTRKRVYSRSGAWQAAKLYIPSTLNIDLILCHTHNWLCVQKMLNHGLNHGFYLLLFKLISCSIHWIVCVLGGYCNRLAHPT